MAPIPETTLTTGPNSPGADLVALLDGLNKTPSWTGIIQIADMLDEFPKGDLPVPRTRAQSILERAARLLLSPPGHDRDFIFTREAFALARHLSQSPVPLAEPDYWRGKQSEMESYLDHNLDNKTLGHVVTSLLICDAALESTDVALARFAVRLLDRGPKAIYLGLPTPAKNYTEILHRAGYFNGNLTEFAQALNSIASRFPQMSGSTYPAWIVATFNLFFWSGASEAVLDMFFHRIVPAALERCAANVDQEAIQVALFLEGVVAFEYTKAREGVERYRQIHSVLTPRLHAFGKALRAFAGPAVERFHANQSQRRMRIGFVLHTPVRLAHTDNLLTFLRGLSRSQDPGIEPYLYTIAEEAPDASFTDAFSGLVSAHRWPDTQLAHPAIWLRSQVRADGVVALVFITAPEYLAVSAGYRSAPVLMFWAMKYHQIQIEGVDGYLTVGNFFDRFRTIDGRTWRSSRMALPPLVDPACGPEAAALRAKVGVGPDEILFGCIGREVKIINPEYIDAVATVMEQVPRSKFMWTGRSARISEVKALMAQRGILERCTFIGWLSNTKAGAAAMDICLDSFPFASGHTGFEIMAAGKPIVVLKTPESLESSTASSLVPAIDGKIGSPSDAAEIRAIFRSTTGESILPYVDTVAEYVALGVRLGLDPAYHAQVGAACRNYVERFGRNESVCATTTVDHIREVFDEAVSTRGGFIDY